MTANMIQEIEDFSERLQIELKHTLANLPQPGEQRVLEFTLSLTMPDMAEFHAEVERVNRKYGFSH